MSGGPRDGDDAIGPGEPIGRHHNPSGRLTNDGRIPAESGIVGHGSSAAAAPRHRHPFLNYIWHTVVAVISVFVLGITGVYWNIVEAGAQGIAAGSVDAFGDNNLITAVPSAGQPDANGNPTTTQATYSPENFLLVGSDTRAGANNIDESGGELEDVANTDSVMVLHISGDRQHIYAVSLPRDMWMPNVPCEAYQQSTNTYGGVSAGDGYEKLHVNSFYGVGGPRCLVDAVENLTQLPITRYIQIDFSGFSSMVDALGGVTINACGPIIDATLSTILESGGEQVIDGAQALNLARARKVEGDPSSDLSRIHRQQLILSAILREVKSAGTLLDPTKLGAFVTAFTDNTSTDGVDFSSLMDLATSLGNLDPALVNFFTIPTVPDENDTERGSMFIDPVNSEPLLNALRNDQPVPGTETPAETATEAPSTTATEVTTLTVDPAAVDLQIVNAAGTSGVAGNAAEALTELGFVATEDDLRTDENTQAGVTVEYAAGNEAAALTVAAAVPGATLVAVDGLGSTISLRLGTGYDGEVTAVAVGDSVDATLLAAIPAGSAGNVLAPTAAVSEESAVATTSVNAADASCL